MFGTPEIQAYPGPSRQELPKSGGNLGPKQFVGRILTFPLVEILTSLQLGGVYTRVAGTLSLNGDTFTCEGK